MISYSWERYQGSNLTVLSPRFPCHTRMPRAARPWLITVNATLKSRGSPRSKNYDFSTTASAITNRSRRPGLSIHTLYHNIRQAMHSHCPVLQECLSPPGTCHQHAYYRLSWAMRVSHGSLGGKYTNFRSRQPNIPSYCKDIAPLLKKRLQNAWLLSGIDAKFVIGWKLVEAPLRPVPKRSRGRRCTHNCGEGDKAVSSNVSKTIVWDAEWPSIPFAHEDLPCILSGLRSSHRHGIHRPYLIDVDSRTGRFRGETTLASVKVSPADFESRPACRMSFWTVRRSFLSLCWCYHWDTGKV